MKTELYANVKKSSYYANQATDEPFLVTLQTSPRQIHDGYLLKGGPGGNYQPSDLDFYHKIDEGNFIKISA